jgi:hypothetical protein
MTLPASSWRACAQTATLMLRRLLLAAVAAFTAFAAAGAPTLPGAGFLLAISLAAIALLFRSATRARSLPTPAGLRARPPAAAAASLLEQAQGRIGQPIQALCPFELRAQDRPGERWQGSQRMWVALGHQTLWFLHDATLVRLGGVWDALPRQGLHILAAERRDRHDVELSWPLMPRLLIGSLGGPAGDRRRLLGLLAELGVRDLLDRPSRH